MSRVRALVPSLLIALLGGAVLRITVGSDRYLQYVKEGLHLPLVASGVLLVLVGAANAARRLVPPREPVLRFSRAADGSAQWHRAEPADGRHRHGGDGGDAQGTDGHGGHGHAHGGTPRVAGLLAVPAVALLFFAPPALGAFTAQREGTAAPVDRVAYAGIATDREVTPMSLTEFIGRSHDPARSLEGRTVRLMGFAAPGARAGEWFLNRLTVNCCAADARRLRVQVSGTAPAPATDSWIEVTGVWQPSPDDARTAVPRLRLQQVRPIQAPRNPYGDTPPPAAAP